jgi:hypothetical protein
MVVEALPVVKEPLAVAVVLEPLVQERRAVLVLLLLLLGLLFTMLEAVQAEMVEPQLLVVQAVVAQERQTEVQLLEL